ncbi:MAG: hypothetical protein GY854_26255 [Deltaproteobacteria bacterium]|nr:hypothetical protein [Deltaproteobacteria bacterium]
MRRAEIRAVLVVALGCEARPFIDMLGLKRDMDARAFEIYVRDDTALIVTGVGKTRSAAATGYLLARVNDFDRLAVLNAGIAGAAPEMGVDVCDAFLINRIIDAGSGREFIPDILAPSVWNEAHVVTFDHAVDLQTAGRPNDGLVDMEASGFYSAANAFVGPHAIGCIKVVSDLLQVSRLQIGDIEKWMASHVDGIVQHLRSMTRLIKAGVDNLGKLEREWLEVASSRLRLTVSQRKMLKETVIRYRVQTDAPLVEIDSVCKGTVETKEQGKKALATLRQRLVRS